MRVTQETAFRIAKSPVDGIKDLEGNRFEGKKGLKSILIIFREDISDANFVENLKLLEQQ
jgi:hypothetical protein